MFLLIYIYGRLAGDLLLNFVCYLTRKIYLLPIISLVNLITVLFFIVDTLSKQEQLFNADELIKINGTVRIIYKLLL